MGGRLMSTDERRRDGAGWCEACAQWVTPRRASFAWRAANVAAWGATLLFLLGSIFTGILMVVLCPLTFVFALFTLGPTAEEAYADPTCPHCRRVVPARASPDPPPESRASRASAPPPLRDVRAA